MNICTQNISTLRRPESESSIFPISNHGDLAAAVAMCVLFLLRFEMSEQLTFFAVPQIFGPSHESFSPTGSYGTGNVCDNNVLSTLQVLMC